MTVDLCSHRFLFCFIFLIHWKIMVTMRIQL